MYRVLIVDDEPFIRNGIQAFVDWEKEGMSAEGDCANGSEALAELERQPADILVTDIKMPLMNGIQLVEQALDLYPGLKVILISSFDDFEYVREGLKLGAVDYLLKPTLEPDNLLAVLRRCVAMIEDERQMEAERNREQQGAIYQERKTLEQEIKRRIVQEQASPLSASPAWLEHRYACIYFVLDGAEACREKHGYLYIQLILAELQEMFYRQVKDGAALPVAESSLFMIFPDDDPDADEMLYQWKQLLAAKWGLTASVGFAAEQGAGQILAGFADSRKACDRRFYEGLGGLYRRSGLGDGEGSKPPYPEVDWTPFFRMIESGDPVSLAMEYALQRWKWGLTDPAEVKQEACDLLSGVYQRKAEQAQLLPERLDLLRGAETLEQLASLLHSQLEEIALPLLPQLDDQGYGGQLISKAVAYMAEHYTGNLTLQDVADVVHLSKSYFSLLFKQQTGRNFSDYLIELRIREAKRLLALEDSRVSDVAAAAGFQDGKYFSKAFKKVTGLSPAEYRDKHRTPAVIR